MSLETIVSKMIAANEPESNIAKVIKYHKKDSSKINCEKCDHSWKINDGGNDLYMCHECGHNNNKSPLKAVATCPDGSEPDEFGKCNEEKELSTSENERILRAERDNKVGVMDAKGNLISEDRGEIGLEKSDPDQAENIALEEVVVRAGGDSRYRDEDQVKSEANIAQKQQESRGKVPSLVDEALGDFNDGIKVDKFALGDPLGLGIFINPVVNLLTGIDEEALQKSQNLDNSFNDIYEKSLSSNPYIKSFTQRALKYSEQDIKNANAEIKENIRNFYISKDEEYREKFDLQIDGLIDSIITEAGVGRYINGNITLNESTTVDDFNVLLNNGLQKEIDDLTNNFINEKIQQDEDYTKAYEEYVKKANQNTSDIIKPLVKKDKVLQDIKKNTLDYLTSRVDKIQEKRIDDQYSGDFSTEDILGRGAKNISKAFYEWSQGTMPAEINEQFLIGSAKKLRNINKDLYELENNPRKNSLGQILTRGGNNNKAFDTIEEAIEFKKQELEDTTKKAAERYAKSKEYQKEVGRFEQFEFFGDKPVTWAGYTKTFGTQAMQAVGNVLSLGTSTLIQESGAAYRDIVERLAAKDLNMTIDKFRKIKPKDRDKAIFEVIKSGRGTNEAISIGTASAGLEFAGNMLMIGGTKVATKGIVDSYVKKEIKDRLISKGKSAGKAFDDIMLASSGEALTEVFQAGTSRGGVAATTGESLVEALASPEAIKEYMESGLQAITTAGPLVGAGRGMRNFLQYTKRNPEGLIMRKQSIGRNYEEKKAEIEKMPTSTTYEKFQKNKALEKLNSDTDLAVEEVTIANEFVQNTIFKNADATTQAEMIENEVELRKKIKEQQSDLEKQENTTDYQKNNSFVYEAREEEVKKRNEEIKKLEGERNLLIVKEYGKKNNDQFLINIVNESTDGKFADKSIKRVETRDEAINELKTRIKNGTLKEEDVYVLENGKRKGYQPQIKLLVEKNEDGVLQNNAAVIGGNFGLIVDENVNENIRKVGDFAAANSVNHEILHFITDDLTSTELKNLKNGIISEIEKSDDQNLKNILSQALEREKSYKEQTDDKGNKIIKGKGSKKILGNEFLAGFSDAMAFYDIKDISLKESSVLDKIATKFNSLFKKQLPKDLNFSELNPSNVVEFITRYNNFNNTKQGTVIAPETKTKTKTKKPNLPSKPLTKEELATEFSTLEKGKIPDQTAVQAAYAYEPLAKSIANRMYRDYPDFKESGFTKDDFAMELTFGQGANSLLGLAKSYDPKVGSIGGYFDRFLPERAKAVMDKFIGKSATNAGTSLDTTEARELEADEKIDVEATDAVEALAVPKNILDTVKDDKTIDLMVLSAENEIKKLSKTATDKQKTAARKKGTESIIKKQIAPKLKQELLKTTKNKDDFKKYLDKNWESVGNAFLNNTDISKIRNEDTRELLEGFEDNGFTKEDIVNYFTDTSLAKNTLSDRKNVGLINTIVAEVTDQLRIEAAKNNPATAEDFKRSTGIPLASRPLGEIARQNAYLKANPNAPQTLPYNTIEKLIAANSGFEKVPVLDTADKAIKFVKSLKDLVFSLPVEIVTKTGFYNPSGRIFPNYEKNKKWINSNGDTTGRFKNNAARAKAAGYFLNKSEGRKKFESIEDAFNTERDALIEDLKANSTVKLYGPAIGFTAYKFADLMGSTPAEILNNKDEILDQNVKAMAMHEQVWKPLYEFIKKDPINNTAPVGFLLKNGSKTATHWHRVGIEMVGTSKKFEGGFTYEHAMPMVSAYLALIDSAAKNVPFDISYPAVQSNYKLLALSKKDDDKLKGPYKAGMGNGWDFYTGNWKERYFNATVGNTDGGINPASIIDLNGENYAKKYNINNKGFSTINLKARVLDFDDTVAKTNSKVLYTLPGNTTQKVTGTGDAFAIRTTVYNEVLNAISKNPNIQRLRFSSDAREPSRVKLYDFITKKLSKDLGWEIDNYETSFLGEASTQDFELVKPKNGGKKIKTKGKYNLTEDEAGNLNTNFVINGKTYDVNINNKDGENKADFEVEFSLNMPGKTGSLDATQFAKNFNKLEKAGATFDYSEFSQVKNGTKGPLADLMKRFTEAKGERDVFILTARPANANVAIQEFLKEALGINIPLENITGLGNGKPSAKANWIGQKVKEGYNDIFFADDAAANVKAVKEKLDQLDVISRVQQAKDAPATLASKPLNRVFYEDGDGVSQIESPLSREFNKMLEKTKGVKAGAVYSDARAAKMGTKKGFQAFVPYSAEDFLGLIYPTLGKGEQGNKDLKWWKDNVMTPYNDGMTNFESAKQAAMIEWNQIKDQIQNTPTNLGKEAVRDFSNEDAIRVYLWDQKGVVPDGLSKKDISALTKHVKANPELEAFANQVAGLNINGYPDPTKGWLAGTITTDLVNHVNTSTRSEMLEPWQQAIDEIYSKDNKNKLRATYGDKYIEALDDILYRMKTGRNRPSGANRITNNWLNWVNDSVGTIMFFNQRSAILQTISSINFINWSDNNPIAAAKAFANQKQYWSDFAELFNSDFLKQRRSGLKTDVNSDEIAQQAAGSTNKVRAGLSLLLKKGFLPTQIADSFAIASGGSTFYRNRINSLMKEGMSEADAKKQAFSDFRDSANESQQSSDPSRISMEQASSLGRVILAFANTPIQYTRLTKRAVQDLMAGRGDWKTNVSKIVYYGAVQNIIFTALQQAMFGMLFADDDDEFQNERKGNATFNIANSTADTFLRGSGVAGAFVAMLKNMALEVKRQSEKSRSDYTKVADKLFTVSPPIDSKFRKLKSAGRAFTYKQELEKMRTRGIALDNPGIMAIAQTISAFGNIPADRVLRKLNNIVESTNDENAIWQRIALAMGWGQWELGIEDRKTREAKIERDAFKRIEKSIGKVVKKREKDAKKKSPIKDLAPGVLGEANRDGSIVVAKGLSKKKREEVVKHEKVHQKEMKSGKLDYDDGFVYYGKKKYERKDGKIMHNGKAKIEGDHSLPWEKVAHNA